MGHAITPTAGCKPADRAASYSPANGRRKTDIETVALALVIADGAVRSDIECYAQVITTDGFDWYSLSQPSDFGGDTDADRTKALQVIANAARYIHIRGDVFPWRLIHSFGDRSIVRFEDKP